LTLSAKVSRGWKWATKCNGYALDAYAEYIGREGIMTGAKPKSLDHIHAAAIATAASRLESVFDTAD